VAVDVALSTVSHSGTEGSTLSVVARRRPGTAHQAGELALIGRMVRERETQKASWTLHLARPEPPLPLCLITPLLGPRRRRYGGLTELGAKLREVLASALLGCLADE